MRKRPPTDDRTDDTTTDADASAGWREEYAAQGVDPDAIGALQAYAFPADRLETVPGGERR